jgi:CubicO group peptidase (beta-lactamase class C family)
VIPNRSITATAIFQLIEQGRLHLSDRVFGPVSVLGTRFGTLPYGPHIEDITIQHLLEHTAGGWQNDSQDPMFQRLDLNQEQLISWTLDHRPLLYPPGTVYLYSNFGYCVLGRVIEEVSGMSYRDYIRQFVLGRSGVNDMEIAGNSASERQPGEAMYVGRDFEPDLSVPYGLPVSRMDAHGS